MGKMVGMAEFKANCTRLLREVGEGGEPITVTVRGKPVAVVAAPVGKALTPVFGLLKSDRYRDVDPDKFTVDPDWEAKWEAKWDARGLPVTGKP